MTLLVVDTLIPKIFMCNAMMSEKCGQAGAELCQGQHQLWKILLEGLDSDQEK